MFFLLRSAFWLSIVIMLLPTPDSMKTPEGVGAGQAISAASATMSDMKQFCVRQPDAGEVGSQALTQFGHKAQASAKWLYEFLGAKLGNDNIASIARQPKAAPVERTVSASCSGCVEPQCRLMFRPLGSLPMIVASSARRRNNSGATVVVAPLAQSTAILRCRSDGVPARTAHR